MFERISSGFAMAKSSWHVIMSDKKLLWFPFISGILFLLVVASFIIPVTTLHENGRLFDANGKPQLSFYILAFGYYFCTYFVIIFCNAALVSCALLRFNGQTPTLGDGFRAAMSRLPQIFAWAFVSATVGLLLKLVEQAHEKAGAFIASLLGTAWSVMTYFVVPVLVVEQVGPFDAVKKSMSILKKTWGEALAGKIGMGLFLFLAALPIIVLLVAGGYLAMHPQTQVLGFILLAAGGVALLAYLAVSAAMQTIFMTAVYQFATSDEVPEGFEQETIVRAFGRAN